MDFRLKKLLNTGKVWTVKIESQDIGFRSKIRFTARQAIKKQEKNMETISTNALSIKSDSNQVLDYETLLTDLRQRFADLTANGNVPWFATDVSGLYDIYLKNLPEENRKYHTCHACKDFIERYGHIVTITTEGKLVSAIWYVISDLSVPFNYYHSAIEHMALAAEHSRVNGMFFTSEKLWGKPVTPDAKHQTDWTHFSIVPPASLVFNSLVQNSFQKAVERKEDYLNVTRALVEFKAEHLNTAMAILESDIMYRSEKVLGPAKFLHDLHEARNRTRDHRTRENLTWLAVAMAPAGFCHPRASMIGTMLEDIIAGKSFELIRQSFASKMRPTQYQRPQAAPSAATVQKAEDLVAKLGIAASLRRRFARLAEVPKIWEPQVVPGNLPSTGIFSNVQTKEQKTAPIGPQAIEFPRQSITWCKFRDTIMRDTLWMEFFIVNVRHNYIALLTAVDSEAPPILQWDMPEARNPVSWYVYNGGSGPQRWHLEPYHHVKVTAIVEQPTMWTKTDSHQFSHNGESVIFILDGARDAQNRSSAIFPENLHTELHGVRAVIEAYSKSTMPEGGEEADANGVRFVKGQNPMAEFNLRCKLRNGATANYKLDRWD